MTSIKFKFFCLFSLVLLLFTLYVPKAHAPEVFHSAERTEREHGALQTPVTQAPHERPSSAPMPIDTTQQQGPQKSSRTLLSALPFAEIRHEEHHEEPDASTRTEEVTVTQHEAQRDRYFTGLMRAPDRQLRRLVDLESPTTPQLEALAQALQIDGFRQRLIQNPQFAASYLHLIETLTRTIIKNPEADSIRLKLSWEIVTALHHFPESFFKAHSSRIDNVLLNIISGTSPEHTRVIILSLYKFGQLSAFVRILEKHTQNTVSAHSNAILLASITYLTALGSEQRIPELHNFAARLLALFSPKRLETMSADQLHLIRLAFRSLSEIAAQSAADQRLISQVYFDALDNAMKAANTAIMKDHAFQLSRLVNNIWIWLKNSILDILMHMRQLNLLGKPEWLDKDINLDNAKTILGYKPNQELTSHDIAQRKIELIRLWNKSGLPYTAHVIDSISQASELLEAHYA